MNSLYEKEDCAVCMNSVSKPLPACGHWVHDECIILWGVAKCPFCFKEQPHLTSKINTNQVHNVNINVNLYHLQFEDRVINFNHQPVEYTINLFIDLFIFISTLVFLSTICSGIFEF
jgi:hypothetical protein